MYEITKEFGYIANLFKIPFTLWSAGPEWVLSSHSCTAPALATVQHGATD